MEIMKKLIKILMAVLVTLAFSSVACAEKKVKKTNEDFEKVCSKVSPLKGSLLKNAYPGHISYSDPRAKGFAFVCGSSDCPKKWPARAYYSDGKLAFKLGYYGRWRENHCPRSYTGCAGAPVVYVSKIVRQAKAKGRDGNVYIAIGNKACRSAVPGKRNGSTAGRCR